MERKHIENVPACTTHTIYGAIDFAQLWVLAHEVAHALFTNGSSRKHGRFAPIHESIVLAIERYELSPMAEECWIEELMADRVGLVVLFEAELARSATLSDWQ